MTQILIAYYSLFGTTDRLARIISEETGGTLRRLLPEKEYSFDYNTACKEARNEIARGYCPKLKAGNEPVKSYDVILIGSPNWFKTFAPPVLSFLRSHDMAGKTVVPFCTHGGGGMGQIETNVARECSGAKVLSGLAVGGEVSHEPVRSWLESLNLALEVSKHQGL